MPPNDSKATVKDPVCGIELIPGGARSWDYLHEMMVYHFCGPDCRNRFQLDPAGILRLGPGGSTRSEPAPEKTSWGSSLRALFQKWRTR